MSQETDHRFVSDADEPAVAQPLVDKTIGEGGKWYKGQIGMALDAFGAAFVTLDESLESVLVDIGVANIYGTYLFSRLDSRQKVEVFCATDPKQGMCRIATKFRFSR